MESAELQSESIFLHSTRELGERGDREEREESVYINRAEFELNIARAVVADLGISREGVGVLIPLKRKFYLAQHTARERVPLAPRLHTVKV